MKLLAWLPCLALGPVTGPLLALAWSSWRGGRPLSAALCVAAIAGFWLGAPALFGAELALLHR